MTQPPEFPGSETLVDKGVAAEVQSALDATFNDDEGGAQEDVEGRLRAHLADAGVLEDVSDRWISWASQRIAAGVPVIAEVADQA